MPITTSTASPLLQAKLKQLSPELPLLEAVEESEACELLPPASVDLTSSGGRLRARKKNRKWADTKDSDASNSGDEQDDQSKSSTDLPSESFESRSNSSASKVSAEARFERTTQDPEAWDILQTKGVTKMGVSALMPLSAVPEYSYAPAGATLTQLLCQIWRTSNGGMSVIPCSGDDMTADCDHEVFWCFLQPQEDGSILITPCSDSAACGVVVDASGASLDDSLSKEPLGAPARPAADAFAPTWIYGQQWPFCVAPTTLILSNLPQDLLQEDLIEILDKEDFNGFYDFLYLPMDDDLAHNSGYAIVNLTRHKYGLALSALMHGRTSWCGTTAAECQVSWSMPLQGRKQLAEHYRNHVANRDSVPVDMRPTFFSGGWPSSFPSTDELALHRLAN